jgi:LmbE family N-acetylglucosaminyl deacetylase
MNRTPGVLALLLLAAVPLSAQLAPPSAGGLAAYSEETRMLGHDLRVLMIGAHPDDEDTELLAYVARGLGGEAAYLALNRGEGGQNLIGNELGEALGVLRSEELLSARRLDGARQYFTRAYDFGFSKTQDDTWAHWPRDSVLKDVVRIIRKFRPQVVVTVFTGTPRDGHGQHQAAGWAARAAFAAAGDAARFPELQREEGLAPWAPAKLYQSTRFDTSGTTLTLNGGQLDRVTGLTFHQLAMASRSRHRSQDMGQIQRLGPSAIRLALINDRTGQGGGGLFAGVDTSLAGLLGTSAARRYDSLAAVIRDGTVRDRAQAFSQAAAVLGTARDTMAPAWRDQARHLARARAMDLGLSLDAVADDDHVTAGQRLGVTTTVANGGDEAMPVRDSLGTPPGWQVTPASAGPERVAPGALASRDWAVTIPADAAPSTPYYLELPRDGDLYRWPASARASWGDPFEPPVLRARFTLPGGVTAVEREVSIRSNDQASGEIRSPVTVEPMLDVRVDRDTVLLPAGAAHALALQVSVAYAGHDALRGQVTLQVPRGWREPAPQPFAFAREGERADFAFVVNLPASADTGRFTVRAVAVADDGRRFDAGQRTLRYEHVRPRSWLVPAAVSVVIAPLALPQVARIGYVRGAADRVPESLAAAGVPVELLTPDQLANGDLSRYDAIVIGPRAYEVDSALVQQNRRLLDYVRAGGLMIVQYQQYQFVRGNFAALPLTIASPHDRVTDEHSPVRLLEPDAPAFTTPNRIAAPDWNGWIQERGLYFAHTWDPGYRPLLGLRDPGEPELDGSLLVAPVGRGQYVYTGLAFFRELPAGVPGAFRLFANLLALKRSSVP